jgi:hypothetical protein
MIKEHLARPTPPATGEELVHRVGTAVEEIRNQALSELLCHPSVVLNSRERLSIEDPMLFEVFIRSEADHAELEIPDGETIATLAGLLHRRFREHPVARGEAGHDRKSLSEIVASIFSAGLHSNMYTAAHFEALVEGTMALPETTHGQENNIIREGACLFIARNRRATPAQIRAYFEQLNLFFTYVEQFAPYSVGTPPEDEDSTIDELSGALVIGAVAMAVCNEPGHRFPNLIADAVVELLALNEEPDVVQRTLRTLRSLPLGVTSTQVWKSLEVTI